MERTINGFLRRWFGVPKSFTSLGLYCTKSKLQLPLKALTEEYKVTKARQVIMIRDSVDEKVREAGVKILTGRKWKAEEAVKDTESLLRNSDIVGTVTEGRLGLGCATRSQWSKAGQKERRTLIQREVRRTEEEHRQTKAAAHGKQGRWLNWEGVQQRKLTWGDIWKTEGDRLRYLLRSVYDVLPSPVNLKRWGLSDNPGCKHCGRPANLEHILVRAKPSLKMGGTLVVMTESWHQ
jgi:hypothetical protein